MIGSISLIQKSYLTDISVHKLHLKFSLKYRLSLLEVPGKDIRPAHCL